MELKLLKMKTMRAPAQRQGTNRQYSTAVLLPAPVGQAPAQQISIVGGNRRRPARTAAAPQTFNCLDQFPPIPEQDRGNAAYDQQFRW
jgi:hypothetical protein